MSIENIDIVKKNKLEEFDHYARNYSGGMENPIKNLFGKNLGQFIEIKAKWLMENLSKFPLKSLKETKLIDYGCGDGTFIKILKKLGFTGKLEGCDISQKMLEIAQKHLSDNLDPSPLYLIEKDRKLPFADNYYDIVVACCVLHHIKPSKRTKLLNELTRITKWGGHIVVFEHNPFNPITQLIVRTTKIDRHASLIAAPELQRIMSSNKNLGNIRTQYILYVPPAMQRPYLEWVDKILSQAFLGGQYVIVGEKYLFTPKTI